MKNYDVDLEHALHLADEADAITKKYYFSDSLHIKTKPDNTPVTDADLAVEKCLSDIVIQEFGESYLGEEGVQNTTGNRLWVVDPIDGTKNFMRHMPLWGTLIALTEDGQTVAAVVSSPALGRRWWAAKGHGAWTRDVDGSVRQIHTSGVSKVADAFLLASTPLSAWNKVPTGEAAVQKLLNDVWRYRSPGDMINYMWVAEGAADATFEPYAKKWDVEAPGLIITEAGGSFWSSEDDSTPASQDRVVIATNGPLKDAIHTALHL